MVLDPTQLPDDELDPTLADAEPEVLDRDPADRDPDPTIADVPLTPGG